MLAATPQPVSSGLVGCGPRAAGAGAIPGVTTQQCTSRLPGKLHITVNLALSSCAARRLS
jgi:hypothetical protein